MVPDLKDCRSDINFPTGAAAGKSPGSPMGGPLGGGPGATQQPVQVVIKDSPIILAQVSIKCVIFTGAVSGHGFYDICGVYPAKTISNNTVC